MITSIKDIGESEESWLLVIAIGHIMAMSKVMGKEYNSYDEILEELQADKAIFNYKQYI